MRQWLVSKVMDIELTVGGDGTGLGQAVTREGGEPFLKEWSGKASLRQHHARCNDLAGSCRDQGLLQGVLVASNRKTNPTKLLPRDLLAEKSEGRSCFRNVLIQLLQQCPQALPSLHAPASSMGLSFSGFLWEQGDRTHLQACVTSSKSPDQQDRACPSPAT